MFYYVEFTALSIKQFAGLYFNFKDISSLLRCRDIKKFNLFWHRI